VTVVTVPSRRIGILRHHNVKKPWNREEPRMNTPKAAWSAAASVEPLHDDSSERQDLGTASTGWDPYEVWRTRVLKRDSTSDAPAGKNDLLPRPTLIRSI